jgi:flagellar motility protein MotE (MotC chaperone)
MKFLIVVFFAFASLNALQTSDRLFDCSEIFKARKNELLSELERIDEQKQSLSALKAATEELLKKKEYRVSQNEESVSKKLADITAKEKAIKATVAQNEKILKEMKELKMSKMSEAFAKMKPANAAGVLSAMTPLEASNILTTLKADLISKILGKMDPKKASEITNIMTK